MNLKKSAAIELVEKNLKIIKYYVSYLLELFLLSILTVRNYNIVIVTILVSCFQRKNFCYWKSRFKGVRTNCFCASLLRTAARANERARQVLKWTMIGQMVIAIALLGFNDLGRSVTPTFLYRDRFYLQLSPHCSNMNKKSMWDVKKISRFLSTGHGILPSCGCKAHETMVSKCELILWGTSPVD